MFESRCAQLSKADVLCFVEDPGAANFIEPLRVELLQRGISNLLLACGLSIGHLRSRGADFVDVSADNLDAQQVIEEYQPRVIVGGTAENTNTLSLKLFEEAKKQGLLSIGVVDMMINADGRFRGDSAEPLAYAPGFIMVPDEESRQAFLQLDFPGDRIAITGYPQFDFVRQRAREIAQAAPDAGIAVRKPKVVFVAEPASKLNPALNTRNADYTLTGRSTSDFRTLIVLEEVLDAISEVELDVDFVVRLHPKNSLKEFESYRDEVTEFSEGGDPLSVLDRADLVIGMTSMLLQEAAWLGKRTLSVVPDPSERNRLPSLACGLTDQVYQKFDLRERLLQFKRNELTARDPEQYFVSGAAGRMAIFIEGLLTP